ncbi:hypothetical protein PIB30_035986 [Stylosanthes scabra]|uniref:Uncharacterized protein n=1 Tax=Stylosanthes scabra TaxID=79078 RepID=A0ABU6TD09_9FABA|nr:hypothetical protein [Stylosanthes scabra]
MKNPKTLDLPKVPWSEFRTQRLDDLLVAGRVGAANREQLTATGLRHTAGRTSDEVEQWACATRRRSGPYFTRRWAYESSPLRDGAARDGKVSSVRLVGFVRSGSVLLTPTKKGARNKEIMKKSLEAKTVTCASVLKGWCACTLQHRCVRTRNPVRAHSSNLDGTQNGADVYA